MTDSDNIIVLSDQQIMVDQDPGFDIIYYIREDIAQWLVNRNIPFTWRCYDRGEGYIKFENKEDAMEFKLIWM